ncbi:alpha 1,2-mannosyltransferase 2.4.1, partial [Teratosphaeriaceae sp. CCFEE 6253]
MAGSQRYLRYILVAFVALVVIFFISASSGVGPGQGYTQKASDLLKGQGSLYKGSDANTVPAGGDSKLSDGLKSAANDVKDAVLPASTASPHDTTSPNPASASLSTSPNVLPGQKAAGPRMNATF